MPATKKKTAKERALDVVRQRMERARRVSERRARLTSPDRVPMKVRATALGFYANERRREGDVFAIEDAELEFSGIWMEPVDDDTPEQRSTGIDSIREQHDRELDRVIERAQHRAPPSTGDRDVMGGDATAEA